MEMTMECAGCKFWSERLAIGKGDRVYAMCLNTKSKKYGRYTIMGCKKHEVGEPVDAQQEG